MKKTVIFDFDGVVIDSHEVQKKALAESFYAVVGKGSPPEKEFFKLSGNSLANIFLELKLPLSMIPVYRSISRENTCLVRVHTGMYELLHYLNTHEVNCALCTGKDRTRTLELLGYLGIEHFFKCIVCSDDVNNPKPSPDGIIKILSELGCCADNAIMIGDGINDIIAAQNANVKCIAVTWGDLPEALLIKEHPSAVVTTPAELQHYILNM